LSVSDIIDELFQVELQPFASVHKIARTCVPVFSARGSARAPTAVTPLLQGFGPAARVRRGSLLSRQL